MFNTNKSHQPSSITPPTVLTCSHIFIWQPPAQETTPIILHESVKFSNNDDDIFSLFIRRVKQQQIYNGSKVQ